MTPSSKNPTEVVIGNQSGKHALARACVWGLRWEILAIYVPKLCYAALSISQVYLIQNAVTYVRGAESVNKGYGLIGAFAIVYTGLAVRCEMFFPSSDLPQR